MRQFPALPTVSGPEPESRWRARAQVRSPPPFASGRGRAGPKGRKPVRTHRPNPRPLASGRSGSGAEARWRARAHIASGRGGSGHENRWPVRAATPTVHPPGRAHGSRGPTPFAQPPAPDRHGSRWARTRCPDDAHQPIPRTPSSGSGCAHDSLGPFDHPQPSSLRGCVRPRSGRGLLARLPRRGKAGNPQRPGPAHAHRGLPSLPAAGMKAPQFLRPPRRPGCGRNQTNTDDAHETA